MDQFEKELIEAQEQRSDAWRDIRAGRFTSSEIWKLMVKPREKNKQWSEEIWKLMVKPREKNKQWSETALTYINTKIAEEITGFVQQPSNAYPLVYGEEQEPFAKEEYKKQHSETIEPAGFVPFTDHSGGSPDGYIKDWLVEIKCPYNSSNQIAYLALETGEDLKALHKDYWYQCQANMLFTKRERCKFITYDPRFKLDKHVLKVLEFEADKDDQQAILDKLDLAIEFKIDKLKTLIQCLKT